MTDDYKVQLSVKFSSGDMLNIRGNSTEEVDAHLTGARELLLPSVAGFVEEAKAVGLITAAFPGTTAVAQQPTYNTQQAAAPAQPAAAPSNGQGQGCQHGTMVWKTGDGWAGYFCPARRDDPTKCKPRYQR